MFVLDTLLLFCFFNTDLYCCHCLMTKPRTNQKAKSYAYLPNIVFDSQLERLLYSLEYTKCYGRHISELQKKVLAIHRGLWETHFRVTEEGAGLYMYVDSDGCVWFWECGYTLGIPAYNRACPCRKLALFCKCSFQWADM